MSHEDSIYSSVVEPGWVTYARNHADPCPDLSLAIGTHILRHEATVRVLGFLEQRGVPVKSLAIIGLGFNDGFFRQSYLPYMLAAYLEAKQADYKMTLFDINPEIIADINFRKDIYTIIEDYSDDTSFNRERAWNIYLAQTHQTDQLIQDPQSDLFVAGSDDLQQFYTIRRAAIPELFNLKLLNGDVRTIIGDVSDNRLSDFGRFDLVDCRFLLMHLGEHRQQVAVANLTRAVRPGGFLFINDRYSGDHSSRTVPLFKQRGGWLTEELLSQLGLTIVPEMTDLPDYSIFRSEPADILLYKSP